MEQENIILTAEQLNDYVGYNITEQPLFSLGTALMIDGGAYELIERCGDDLVFAESEELDHAERNMIFFREQEDELEEAASYEDYLG